jgi:hypothetical protein
MPVPLLALSDPTGVSPSYPLVRTLGVTGHGAPPSPVDQYQDRGPCRSKSSFPCQLVFDSPDKTICCASSQTPHHRLPAFQLSLLTRRSAITIGNALDEKLLTALNSGLIA